MGYSARYHATSMIAVFLALAVGILIGAEFGGDVISSTREGLERSLQESLSESQEEIDGLEADLDRNREFGRRVYPALVGDRLAGLRVGVVALGEKSESNVQRVETALEPTGAEVVAFGALREPPRIDAIAGALEETRFAELDDDAELVYELAELIGEQIVRDGNLYQLLRGELFSRVSGAFGELDRVIVLRARPEDMSEEEDELTESLENGILSGLEESGAIVVAAESSEVEQSSADFFDEHGIATVDNIDQAPGRLSLILTLLGAQGKFGVKGSADSLMPDVIPGLGPGVPTLPVDSAGSPAAP